MPSDQITETRTAIRELLVSELGTDEDMMHSRPSATLADLGVDSLAAVELSVLLRKRYGVVLDGEELVTMTLDAVTGAACGRP